jgi:hypothetical protein
MGIVVNLSQKEADSAPLDPIPSGKYHFVISDVELKESKSKKNPGKPFYSFEFTVQESDKLKTPETAVGRKVFASAMLWDGALYTIVNILKALGRDVESGQLEIPEPEDFLGLELIGRVVITPKRTVKDENTGETKEYEPRNDIKSFYALDGAGASATSNGAGASFLP